MSQRSDDDLDPTERVGRFVRASRDKLALSGFRKFILRGNVVDLAIGIVIGAAFTAVVNSLVKDFLTPLVGIALHNGKKGSSFADHYWTIGGSRFKYGDFLNSLLTLMIVGLALYYFVVVPVNSLMERFKPDTEPGQQQKVCPECKSSIPYDATRCAFCGVKQPPLAKSELKTSSR